MGAVRMKVQTADKNHICQKREKKIILKAIPMISFLCAVILSCGVDFIIFSELENF